MMSSSASGPPSTSVTLQHLYSDVFRPVFFPAPADFIQPLLDSFVASQDQLLEDNKLFTIPTRTREIGIEIDGAIREFRRREAVESASVDKPEDMVLLDEVRKLRLRSRMQTVLLPASWTRLSGRRDDCGVAKLMVDSKLAEPGTGASLESLYCGGQRSGWTSLTRR